jgi:uncharacterized protein GlcG (DUF336 family)
LGRRQSSDASANAPSLSIFLNGPQVCLGASRNEDSSGAIAQRIGQAPSAGGLAKLPHVLLLGGAVRIKAGNEPIAAIGVGGAPGKISDRLK